MLQIVAEKEMFEIYGADDSAACSTWGPLLGPRGVHDLLFPSISLIVEESLGAGHLTH